MDKNLPKFKRITLTNYLRTGFSQNDIDKIQFVEAEIQYDEKGNVVSETHFRQDGAVESKEQTTYDAEARPVVSAQWDENDELCQKNTFRYDEKGNVVRKGTFFGSDSPEYVTIYVFENERLIREDAYDAGAFDYTIKTYEYDENGRVARVLEYDEDGEVLYATTDTYDAHGWLVQQLREEPQQHDSRTFVFEYDEYGRRTKELCYNYSRKLIAKVYYQRDEKGNVTEMEEENLDSYRLTQYLYEENNCVKITQLDREQSVQSCSTYVYNENGDAMHVENHILDEVNPSLLRVASIIDYEITY